MPCIRLQRSQIDVAERVTAEPEGRQYMCQMTKIHQTPEAGGGGGLKLHSGPSS